MKRDDNGGFEPLQRRIGSGLVFGACFSAFVPLILLGALVEGAWEFRVRSSLLHAGVLALTYPAGATVTGVLLMSLQPYLHWTPLALVWGAVSMIPWAAGIALASDRGYAVWTPEHSWMVGIVSVFLGAGFGYAVREIGQGGQRKARE